MKLSIRRTAILGAVALMGATALVAPAAASADVALPVASNIYLSGYDAGDSGAAVDVRFTAPGPTYDATKVLVGYKALLKSGVSYADTVQTQTTDNINTSWFTFTGLTYGTSYSVGIVSLYTVNGVAEESLPAYPQAGFFGDGPVTPMHHTPGVTGLSATSRASGKLTLNWHAPVIPANTDPVSYYSILVTPNTDDVDYPPAQQDFILSSCEANCTSLTVNGLRNGVLYDVVVSTTSAIYSPYLDDAYTSATPYGAPSKPSSLTAKRVGTKAQLRWKSAKSTAAGPVSGYKVYVNGKVVATLGKTSTAYTKTGVKKGKYVFAIRAYNAHGTSAAVSVTKKWTS